MGSTFATTAWLARNQNLPDLARPAPLASLTRMCHEAWVRHECGPDRIESVHATRQAFEEDVARRRRSGHIAYTYGDVTERGASTAADLRRLLRS